MLHSIINIAAIFIMIGVPIIVIGIFIIIWLSLEDITRIKHEKKNK